MKFDLMIPCRQILSVFEDVACYQKLPVWCILFFSLFSSFILSKIKVGETSDPFLMDAPAEY